MGKISNKILYPEQGTVNASDFLIGSDGETKITKTFNIGKIAALLSTVKAYEYNLTAAATIQNDDFMDVNGVYGFVQGQSFAVGTYNNSIEFIDNLNTTTGTITIGSAFSPFTGKVTIFVW